jgi:hypothetical protein
MIFILQLKHVLFHLLLIRSITQNVLQLTILSCGVLQRQSILVNVSIAHLEVSNLENSITV